MGPDPAFLATTIHSHANVFLYGRLPLPGFSAPSYNDLQTYYPSDDVPSWEESVSPAEYNPATNGPVNEPQITSRGGRPGPRPGLPIRPGLTEPPISRQLQNLMRLWRSLRPNYEIDPHFFVRMYLSGGLSLRPPPFRTPIIQPHQHHVFPVQFEPQFRRLKIPIHQFTITIPASTHYHIHYQGPLDPSITPPRRFSGQGWNAAWREFLTRNPDATREQVMEHAREMINVYGIGGLPIRPHDRLKDKPFPVD
jgi:hypothetical protein